MREKMDEFFKMMKEAEEKGEPFRQFLLSLNQEFHQFLLTKYSERTAQKHTSIVELFIDFICRQTDVESIEEITRGMVNTHFKKWWKRKVWDSTSPDELTVALRKFFLFLSKEKNIVNENVLKALQ
jgi:site-specific recombinase XerD